MTEEIDGVLLTDGRSRIFLLPPEPYPGNGFHHRVHLVGGPFQGTINASSYEGPGALRSFHQQLVALHESLKGEARLPQSYENLAISISGDGRGHMIVQVEATAGSLVEVRLGFRFSIDQTQLPEIIAGVERLFLKDPR